MLKKEGGIVQRFPQAVPTHQTAGRFSQVAVVGQGPLVCLSGQGPIDLDGNVVEGDIVAQTRAAFDNCAARLNSIDLSLDDVFKVTVYLADLSDWHRFNSVYGDIFMEPYPVRTTVGASLLREMKIEVDVWALPLAVDQDVRLP